MKKKKKNICIIPFTTKKENVIISYKYWNERKKRTETSLSGISDVFTFKKRNKKRRFLNLFSKLA